MHQLADKLVRSAAAASRMVGPESYSSGSAYYEEAVAQGE